jgi:nicotinamidase-related amidase
MKPALLVIDVQKAFFEITPATAQSLNEAVEYINAAIELFRAKNLPIICIQHMDAQLKPGVAGFDVPDSVLLQPGDVRIHKVYSNAFTQTPLKDELGKLGIDTLILTGFCAEYCVLSTYRGAQDVDLHPIMLRGSLASGSAENIRFVENISDLISYGALKILL